MKQKLKALFLLVIFSMTFTEQTASASTYYVNNASDEVIQFNRAMAANESDFTIEYNPDEDDYALVDLSDYKYSLQDYADSDYGYYNMSSIDGTSEIETKGDTEKYSVEYNVDRIETPKQTQYVYDKIHQLIRDNASIIKASDYDKAAWAYDYIIRHVSYDYSYQNYSAYAALHDGNAVCQGYALLYYAFATELGLTCKIVSGMAGEASDWGSHGWNALKLEGKWYYVDTTWGAATQDRSYFLVLKKDLTDHILDSQYDNYFDFATTNYVDKGNSGYEGVQASVYNVKFDPLKKDTLAQNETFQWMQSNPDDVDLTFTSDNTEVATVSDKGVITGICAGTTKVYAKNDDLGIEQACEITVKGSAAKVTGVHKVSVIYNKTSSIISNNKKIAAVDRNGTVTGVRAGSTSIRVCYGNQQTVSVPVTVNPAVNSRYQNIAVSVNKSRSIRNAVAVSSRAYKDLSYKTINPNLVKVSSTGIITGVKKGKCSIKIYDRSNNKLVDIVRVTIQ